MGMKVAHFRPEQMVHFHAELLALFHPEMVAYFIRYLQVSLHPFF